MRNLKSIEMKGFIIKKFLVKLYTFYKFKRKTAKKKIKKSDELRTRYTLETR